MARTSAIERELRLRCAGVEEILEGDAFTCYAWVWRRWGNQGGVTAMVVSGDADLTPKLAGDLLAFLATVRLHFDDPLVLAARRGDALLSREDDHERETLRVVHKLKLAYEDRSREGAPGLVLRRGRATKPGTHPDRLGDVAPLVRMVSALESFCRRSAETQENLLAEVIGFLPKARQEAAAGEAALADGRVADAIKLLKKSLSRDGAPATRLLLARALLKSGNAVAARQAAVRARAEVPHLFSPGRDRDELLAAARAFLASIGE